MSLHTYIPSDFIARQCVVCSWRAVQLWGRPATLFGKIMLGRVSRLQAGVVDVVRCLSYSQLLLCADLEETPPQSQAYISSAGENVCSFNHFKSPNLQLCNLFIRAAWVRSLWKCLVWGLEGENSPTYKKTFECFMRLSRVFSLTTIRLRGSLRTMQILRSNYCVQRLNTVMALELCLKKSRLQEQQSPSCDQEATSSSVTRCYVTLSQCCHSGSQDKILSCPSCEHELTGSKNCQLSLGQLAIQWAA